MSNVDETLQERRLRLAASRDLNAGLLNEEAGMSTSNPMDQQLVDAKIAAAEARTDVKFERLIGRLESMDGKLNRIEAEGIRTRSTVRTTGFTVVSIIVAVLGLLFAVFSQSFNLGSKVSDVAHAEAVAVLGNVVQAPVALPSPAASALPAAQPTGR